MKLILMMLVPLLLTAQMLQVQPGGETTLTPGGGIVALQFETPAGATVSSGPAIGAAGKTLTCATAAERQVLDPAITTGRCVVVGPNQTVLTGHIVTMSGLPSLARGSDEAAAAPLVIPVVQIFSACDLNQNGGHDVGDLSIATQQILGTAVCGSADIDGDSECTAVDAQRIANAAAGGACQAN